ncbi:hypothetical protein NMG60_11032990 [Bertholletia excelsa]
MVKSSVFLTVCFLLPLLTPLIHCSVSDQNDLVTDTCRKTPKFQLCVSTAKQDPRSRSADIAGLGLIIVDAVKAKSTTIMGQIKKLIVSKPQLKGPLKMCAEYYGLGILQGDIPQAIEALTKGDPKFAETAMVDAGNEANYCEEGFGRSPSPLTAMNKEVNDLAAVATAISRMLL